MSISQRDEDLTRIVQLESTGPLKRLFAYVGILTRNSGTKISVVSRTAFPRETVMVAKIPDIAGPRCEEF
ncbi:hypothetical protein Pan258_30750 [Symmachiella dynata]|nr:hypothetical protein Pan258_30750 [Symmachiella dynata]